MINLITKETFYKNINKNEGFWKFDIPNNIKIFKNFTLKKSTNIYFKYSSETTPSTIIYFVYLDDFQILIIPNKYTQEDISHLLSPQHFDYSEWKLIKISDEIPINYSITNFSSRITNFGEYFDNEFAKYFFENTNLKFEDWKEKALSETKYLKDGVYELSNKNTGEVFKFVSKTVIDYSISTYYLFDDLFNYPVDIKEVNKKEKLIREIVDLIVASTTSMNNLL